MEGVETLVLQGLGREGKDRLECLRRESRIVGEDLLGAPATAQKVKKE
jgi:hypothetical protein